MSAANQNGSADCQMMYVMNSALTSQLYHKEAV